MTRHIKLNSIQELKNFLSEKIFQHIYVSGAYYHYPEAQTMGQKDRIGSDFLIDIDADHFLTPCKNNHDSWVCRSCGKKGTGVPPEKCKCGGNSYDEFTWICDNCLNAAKKEVLKFHDYFLPSFDIPEDSISIHFSGNRGYHIIIQSETIMKLDQLERREFIDYLTGTGLNLRSHAIKDKGTYISGPTKDSLGWGKLIYNYLLDLINNSDKGSLTAINLSKNTIEQIISNKNEIIDGMKLSNIQIRHISPPIWFKLIHYAIEQLSLKIDIPVSIDLHRLIRFVNSLHGKTGFIVKDVPIDNLNSFDPFSDAIAFSPDISVKIEVSPCPEFRIGDIIYGPFEEKQLLNAPLPVAVFTLCKGTARMIN